jgi:radical SAM superfamily enzyme YgiQ (UPF0313 family)
VKNTLLFGWLKNNMPYQIFESKKKSVKKVKNIALVDVGRTGDERQSNNENQYNLALGYLGAMLLKEGYNVLILQESPGVDDRENLLNTLVGFSPDLIGYSSFSYQFKGTLKFKKELEKRLNGKGVISILGGIHASMSPKNSAKYFDYLVFSEGEETLKELLLYLNKSIKKELNEIQGLYFLDHNRKLIFTGRRERIINLDKYGAPLRLHFDLPNSGMVTPIPDDVTGFAPITLSRGCIRACAFCTNKEMMGCGKKARVMRNPEDIAKEIKKLYNKHNVNYFYTHDEDYTYDEEFIDKLSDVLISYKKDKKFGQIYIAGMGSIASFYKNGKPNKPLIKKFAKAGCHMIALGVERVTNLDLIDLHKGTTIKEVKEVTGALLESGIAPVGLFIYGLQGDKKKELEFMIEQAIKIPAIRYRFAAAYPLNGTEWRDNLPSDAWIDKKFRKDNYANCETPVLKTNFSKSVDDVGYKYLLNFEKRAQRKIYASKDYADGIKKFKKATGKRFDKFFSKTWKDILTDELGDIKFRW